MNDENPLIIAYCDLIGELSDNELQAEIDQNEADKESEEGVD